MQQSKLRLFVLATCVLLISTSAFAKGKGSGRGKKTQDNTPVSEPATQDCYPEIIEYYNADGTLAFSRYAQSDLTRYCEISNGDLFCWGRNDYGQVGNGDTGFCEAVPETEKVLVLSGGVTEVALTHFSRTCAIQNGMVVCWGDNNLGALGNADEDYHDISNRSTPRIASLISPTDATSMAVAVRTGSTFSCATINGADVCAGWNGVWY